MKIVYCVNRKLYNLLSTTLNSLLINNPQLDTVYLLIEDDNIDYISHPKIKFINVNNYDFIIKKNFNCTRQFPYISMVRCVLAKILKNEDKIIYLDVDTIIDESLEELWSFDLKNNFIAGREEQNGYINSGVLLMNLKLIREKNKTEQLINILKKCRFIFPDQDALNIIFKNRIGYIPEKFNKIGPVSKAFLTETIIRHYAGTIKPWHIQADQRDKDFWNKYKIDYIKKREIP